MPTLTIGYRTNAARADRTADARFARAVGVAEVQIDGGKASTTTGWRDVPEPGGGCVGRGPRDRAHRDGGGAIRGEAVGATARRQAGAPAGATDGGVGVQRRLARAVGESPTGSSGDEWRGRAGDLGAHPTRLGEARRPASGRGVGSGLIEGSVEPPVNRRTKLTGALACGTRRATRGTGGRRRHPRRA